MLFSWTFGEIFVPQMPDSDWVSLQQCLLVSNTVCSPSSLHDQAPA
uniref:Fimbrin-1-like n=1 Tax=Rhizophora mucronata TaxID=61149 RepID=A0A2P2LH97_RHIMU